jgi:hypothetical protein
MAESPPVAVVATPAIPSIADIERAVTFTREPFLLEGEDAQVALAPGSARRLALDAALVEMDEGHTTPSVAWRRTWSLLLGLDRLLTEEEPRLVDGTLLSAHQVDALSGTLTALLAESQVKVVPQVVANGANGEDALLPLASAGIPGEDDDEEDDEPEEPQDWDGDDDVADDDQLPEQPEDPNAARRFWFEHATGAGKTVAALGFVEASRTGGVLILTHRRNLVDQFLGELRDRGYANRIAPPLLGTSDRADGPVTVETYQWFVRNAGQVSDAYAIVICDEAHTALGEKTSASIRNWAGPVFVGMTATGALIARHVTDLFPTQTSRFDLAQAARRGVIAPLRCVRIPPGPGVRTIAKVPLRRGEVDTEFDQEMLAELLDQLPFNLAIADLYKTRFNGVPGVVYAAGVRHAYNVAEAFRDVGLKAQAVSGETPKRELALILARYEKGEIDVLVNAQLLAEGWNSPRATVCMHLAPTASKRIYQQRVGRVTRRHPGKEAGIVVDFVHPATKHDDPVVTLHSLLDRDVYRGGAIVVGPVRRGRGRRVRVERRVLPVTGDETRRIEVFERELWRIAVEHLDYGEQIQWAALAGARVVPTGWRRARAMLHFDQGGELKRTFLLTAVDRNKNPQLRLRALQEIAASRDAEAFDRALDFVEGWPREDRREGVKAVLLALAEKKVGRRDQANNWIWRCANMTREVHEEYAVQRWPETKRLLGLLVNSSAGAHARNARRLVQSSRQQDRRLSAALLAAAVPHTAEAGEIINGARTRMSRKPAALARELLRNFPKGRGKKAAAPPTRRRRGRKGALEGVASEAVVLEAIEALEPDEALFVELDDDDGVEVDAVEAAPVAEVSDEEATAAVAEAASSVAAARRSRRSRSGSGRSRRRGGAAAAAAAAAAAVPEAAPAEGEAAPAADADAAPAPVGRRRPRTVTIEPAEPAVGEGGSEDAAPAPTRRRTRRVAIDPAVDAAETPAEDAPRPRRRRATRTPSEPVAAGESATPDAEDAAPRPARRTRRSAAAPAVDEAVIAASDGAPEAPAVEPAVVAPSGGAPEVPAQDAPKPVRRRAPRKAAAPAEAVEDATAGTEDAAPRPARRTRKPAAAAAAESTPVAAPEPAALTAPSDGAPEPPAEDAPKPVRRRAPRKAALPAEAVEDATAGTEDAAPKSARRTRKPAATTTPEAAPEPVAATAPDTSLVAPSDRAAEPSAEDAPKPVRKRAPRKAAAAAAAIETPPAVTPAAETVGAEGAAPPAAEAAPPETAAPADAAPKPVRKRAPRKPAAAVTEAAATEAAATQAASDTPAAATAETPDAAPKPVRKRAPRKTAAAEAPDPTDPEAPKPARKRAPRKAAEPVVAVAAADGDAPEPKPARKRAPRKTATAAPDDVPADEAA